MLVRKFVTLDDLDQINSWLEKRQKPKLASSLLSRTGFIIDDVAVCFVYSTDSGVCFLDGLISNPDSEQVNEGINKVVGECLNYASKQGYQLVLSFSENPNVISRAEKTFNFSQQPKSTLIKKTLNSF